MTTEDISLHNRLTKVTPESSYEFVDSTLGPILSAFFWELHSALERSRSQKALFCMRAGIRLKHAMERWQAANSIAPSYEICIFPISRIAALRCCWHSTDISFIEQALATISNAHGWSAFERFFDVSISRESTIFSRVSLFTEACTTYFSSTSSAISERLLDHRGKVRKFLEDGLSEAGCNVIVDTGWSGTTQLFLEQAFPDHQFVGIYLATDTKTIINGITAGHIIGLLHDENTTKDDASSAILDHRHLFESVFEPNIPSCGFFPASSCIYSLDQYPEDVHCEWDVVYRDLLSFLSTTKSNYRSISSLYVPALSKLRSIIDCPSVEDIPVLACKQRGHDMGRSGKIPVVDINGILDSQGHTQDLYHIWDQGAQLVDLFRKLSHDQDQFQATDATLRKAQSSLSTYLASKSMQIPDSFRMRNLPYVSVITRTKNWPVLLGRAIESVASQSYPNVQHVIINDGGSVIAVENQLIERISSSGVQLIHNPESVGMEAASNMAIRKSTGDLIVIHDDDDSWHPDFLSKSVAFLQDHPIYKGVVCHSRYISESVEGCTVSQNYEKDYNQWLEYVMISEMAINNIFPPISFLFWREAYDAIGGFNEDLQVLGDWDFNLKFLARYDIGVLRETLANYHHRDNGCLDQGYANSVIGGIDKHKLFRPIMINSILRSSDPALQGIKQCLAAGYLHSEIRGRSNQ